ncbi:MAG: UDP-N-acetylmuramate--L-alanine ligase [Paludibacteraceae bacterium]
MAQLQDIQNIFFLGVGGIGMSALARYYRHCGKNVGGYDRTPSALTKELEKEGIMITYDDDANVFNSRFSLFNSPEKTLVVRTPAVPADSIIYTYLRERGFEIHKRAEVLGMISREKKALCVAGTHGKTTTSTMIAHLMQSNAFLGGISMNYGTNLLLNKDSEYVTVEADEYDRSFHHLAPYISVVTSVDADHLDIYGTPEAYRDAFAHYTSLITGALVMKKGIALQPRLQTGVKCYTYSATGHADFYADNIRISDGQISFDYQMPDGMIENVRLGVPVWVNIENAVAAMAVAHLCGAKDDAIREAIASFRGVQRRFNIHVNTPKVVYIDDYAHHPDEIATSIDSVRRLYPSRKMIGVFQPHLYTRTRDFADGFVRVLSTLDECILLPIYPARELPIPGVTSDMLLGKIGRGTLIEKADLAKELKSRVEQSDKPVVIMTIGAGDIDRLVPEITEILGK